MILVVTTNPVVYPILLAASMTLPQGSKFGSTEMAPLYDLRPQLNAVAPAAESVTSELELLVLDCPIKWSSSMSVSSQGSCSVYCLQLLVNVSDVEPMPSETMNMRFLLPPALLLPSPLPDVWELCCHTTASTITAAVAMRAQTKRPISRHRWYRLAFRVALVVAGVLPVLWPVRRASSSSMPSSPLFCEEGRCITGAWSPGAIGSVGGGGRLIL